jgi:hypothetical protein
MKSGIATARLEEASLDVYLGLPIWNEIAISPTLANEQRVGAIPNADQDKIRALLSREHGGWLGDVPFTLKKPLQILFTLGRASEEQYLVLSDICDALNRDRPRCVATFDESELWQQAISIARAYHPLRQGAVVVSSRVRAVAKAIQQIEARGFPVQITTFGPTLSAEALNAICSRISDGIRRVGGRTFVDAIFNWYSANRRVYHGSFLFGRDVDQFGRLREPSIPWHYLYNLALPHFASAKQTNTTQADLSEAIELARDMASVFDVESYVIYENMGGVGHSSFHQSILDRVMYDELFAFQQWQPEVAGHLFRVLFEHLREQGCKMPHANAEQWIAFSNALLMSASETSMILRHPSECVSASVDAQLSAKLFAALAIPLKDANSGYLTPRDTLRRSAPDHPFYSYSTDFYLLPPRAILARGLYEGVHRLLRKRNDEGHLDNWLGEALERMTVDTIAQFGHEPAIVHQKYRTPGQRKRDAAFDIDVAETTDHDVFLLECKKKGLTDNARGGNTLHAIIDFANGFLRPLIQANRHEAELRSVKGLTLLDGRVFKLEGRNLIRLAITMTDHGSMQDRPFLRGMIGALWGTTLTSGDPALQKEADKVSGLVATLTGGIERLASLAGEELTDYSPAYAGGCWFLGIDQLRFLCSKSTDLRRALSPMGSITYGTGDIMTELAHADRTGLLKAFRTRAAKQP